MKSVVWTSFVIPSSFSIPVFACILLWLHLYLPHASKVLFLALSASSSFVCDSSISRMAEWFCAKFTGKTCLVPCLDKVEFQGQRWRSLGTKTEKLLHHPQWQCIVRRKRCKWCHPAADVQHKYGYIINDSSKTQPLCYSWAAMGWWQCMACMRFMFGKTSLGLLLICVVICHNTSIKSSILKLQSGSFVRQCVIKINKNVNNTPSWCSKLVKTYTTLRNFFKLL